MSELAAQPREESRDFWETAWSGSADLGAAQLHSVFKVMDDTQFAFIERLLPPGRSRALEVGAGTGQLSQRMAVRGHEIFCVDYSDAAISLGQREWRAQGLRDRYVQGDATQLPFADDSFDVVLSNGLLEHFEDPLPIMREMVRVLKPGGLFHSTVVAKTIPLLHLNERTRVLLGGKDTHVWELPLEYEQFKCWILEAGIPDGRVRPGGVWLPRLPFVTRHMMLERLDATIANAWAPVARHLDNTLLAKKLGFYYLGYGHKPERPGDADAR